MRIFSFIILVLHYLLVSGQELIKNGSFEELNKASSTLANHWHTGGSAEICNLDSSTVWKGKYSLHILKKTENGFAYFSQDTMLKTQGLKKYRVSGVIKTRNVNEKYAGVFAKITDKQGHIICVQDMHALQIKNTNDWKTYEAEIYSDKTAEKLRVAGLLYGSGEVWFDDIMLEEIPLSDNALDPVVEKYLNEYFAVIKSNSIVRDSAYLIGLENNAKQLCRGVSGISSTHPIFKNYITPSLKDGHSFFLSQEEWTNWQSSDKTVQQGLANFANGKMLGNNIAYINIPTFISLDSVLNLRYADSLQMIIARLDTHHPKGWIIDLSNNSGGNSWAMICGLGPLLGNGSCGFSVSANGEKMSRFYKNGSAGWDSVPMIIKKNPYQIKDNSGLIAVLYSNQTASSAEVVALAFKGLKNTRSFGQMTAGATTRIDNFRLSDGAYLNLACGIDADRNGNLYGGKINPDMHTKDNDQSIAEAVSWIINYNSFPDNKK